MAAPVPDDRACYDYGYAAAIAPVAAVRRCRATATTRPSPTPWATSTRWSTATWSPWTPTGCRPRSPDACPQAFDRFVGGSVEARRLTMLRPVWFTPSLEQSDSGANWYRCDAVAIAADEAVAPLVGRLQGVLARPLAAERYAMCGTAEPGTAGFRRVVCSTDHTWRAAEHRRHRRSHVPRRRAGPRRRPVLLQDAASAVADDPLNYRWGDQWPTEQQWQSGQHYWVLLGTRLTKMSEPATHGPRPLLGHDGHASVPRSAHADNRTPRERRQAGPVEMPLDVGRCLEYQAGVISRRQVLEGGWTRSDIDRMVRRQGVGTDAAGHLREPHRPPQLGTAGLGRDACTTGRSRVGPRVGAAGYCGSWMAAA